MNNFGGRDPGLFGYRRGIKIQNTSIKEQANKEGKITSMVFWMRMAGGLHLNMT